MASYFQCGFMRSAVINGHNIYHHTKKERRFLNFKQQFVQLNDIDETYFHRKSKDLMTYMRKQAWYGDNRKLYLEMFSSENWSKLSLGEKMGHSLNLCNLCANNSKYSEFQNYFPKPANHRKKETNNLKLIKRCSGAGNSTDGSSSDATSQLNVISFTRHSTSSLSSSENSLTLSDQSLNDGNLSKIRIYSSNALQTSTPLQTKISNISEKENKSQHIHKNVSFGKTSILTDSNKTNTVDIPITSNTDMPFLKEIGKTILNSWDQIYKVPLTNVIPKITNLTPRKNKEHSKTKLKKLHRKFKKNIENQIRKDSNDVETLYGTRQSGSSYQKQRTSLYFESKADAIKRTSKSKFCLKVKQSLYISRLLKSLMPLIE